MFEFNRFKSFTFFFFVLDQNDRPDKWTFSCCRSPEPCFCPETPFSEPILCSASNHCRLCSSELLCGVFFGGGGVVVLVGCWLTWWETWAVMRLWSGCAGHSGPSDKSIRRIPFDWVCAALWRGLKPKLTSPFDAAAPSCSDESTHCLWNKPRGFVVDPHTSWCLITSRGVSAGGHYCPDTKF